MEVQAHNLGHDGIGEQRQADARSPVVVDSVSTAWRTALSSRPKRTAKRSSTRFAACAAVGHFFVAFFSAASSARHWLNCSDCAWIFLPRLSSTVK